MICPKCGFANDNNRLKCMNCDADFTDLEEKKGNIVKPIVEEKKEDVEIFDVANTTLSTPVVKETEDGLPVITNGAQITQMEETKEKPQLAPNVNPEGKSLQEQLFGNAGEAINTINNYSAAANSIPTEVVSSYETFEKKKFPFIAVLAIVLVVGVLGFSGWFFFLKPNPKKVFNTMVDTLYSKINSNLVADANSMNGVFDMSLELKENGANIGGYFDIISNIKIDSSYGVDYKNKIANTNMNITYDNDPLINVTAYLENEKAYFYLNDLYSKYISYDVKEMEIFKKTNTKEYKNVLEEVKNAIVKSMKSEYFTSKKEEIKINNKTMKVTKNAIILNSVNILDFITSYYTYLIDSDSYVSSLATINSGSVDEIKDELQATLNSTKEELINDTATSITIDIFTSGLKKEFVELDLTYETSDETSEIIITKDKENNYSYKVSNQKLELEKEVYLGTLEIIESSEKNNYKFAISYGKANILLDIGYKIEYNNNIKKTDVTNNITLEEFFQSDLDEVEDKFLKNKGVDKIIDAVMGSVYTYNDI